MGNILIPLAVACADDDASKAAMTQRYLLRVKKTSGAVDALDAALADAGKIRSREDHACG